MELPLVSLEAGGHHRGTGRLGLVPENVRRYGFARMGTRDWHGQSGPVEKRKSRYEDESTTHVEVGKCNELEA